MNKIFLKEKPSSFSLSPFIHVYSFFFLLYLTLFSLLNQIRKQLIKSQSLSMSVSHIRLLSSFIFKYNSLKSFLKPEKAE